MVSRPTVRAGIQYVTALTKVEALVTKHRERGCWQAGSAVVCTVAFLQKRRLKLACNVRLRIPASSYLFGLLAGLLSS